ncbi:hypothetical protein QFZ58_006294 [Streptomyces sp. B1I3]|nr:hypothetical protein [Streptomyces sp. B1I3]
MATLWYADPDGVPADYTHPRATPLAAGQAASVEKHVLPQRHHTLDALTRQAARSVEPVQLAIPAYRLPDGGGLLLDGTHRVVAALRGQEAGDGQQQEQVGAQAGRHGSAVGQAT